MDFEDRLKQRISVVGSNLCIGLDPRPENDAGDLFDSMRRVIRQTAAYAAAFKPNIAYFEAMGAKGYLMLEKLLEEIPEETPVILDVKRGDIGETAKYYARAYFDHWKVDAVTLNPFLGFDTIEPFLEYENRGVYLLALTSNPGAHEFMRQKIGGEFVYEHVQRMHERAATLPGTVGLVLGLTNLEPEVLERIHDLPLLLPGLGAQGGDLATLKAQKRKAPLLVNVSRGILYNDMDKSYAEKAQDFAARIKAALKG